jgi:hypothetical protein
MVVFKLISGSNGQDFPSKCHLERFACENRQSHLVKSQLDYLKCSLLLFCCFKIKTFCLNEL